MMENWRYVWYTDQIPNNVRDNMCHNLKDNIYTVSKIKTYFYIIINN